MGTFVEQIEKNNRLQVQNLSYKKQVQLQKEEARKKREKEKEKKENIKALKIGCNVYFNNIFNNNYNSFNYKNIYTYLIKNRNDYINNYIIEIDLKNQDFTQYEKDLLYFEFLKIYDSLNNKYYSNYKKIENIEEIEEESEEETPQKNKILNIIINIFLHVLAAFIGICTGFLFGICTGEKSKKRRY